MHQAITWVLDPLEPGVRAQALIDFGGRAQDDPQVIAAQEESLVRGSIAKVLNGLTLTPDHDSYEKLMDPRYGTPYHRLVALVDMGAPRGDARVHATLERILEVFAKPDGGFGRTGGQHLGVEAGYEPWRRIHFPRHYYYDFLLGLELVTRLGNPRDSRLKPALDLLASKPVADDRWAIDITHPDVDPEGDPPYKSIMGKILATVIRLEVEPPGNPSRWATLAAMRVLREISADHTSIPGR